MSQTAYVRFSYEDKVSEEIAINLGVELDLTKNSNRKKLINRLLKSNSNITGVTLLSWIPNDTQQRTIRQTGWELC